MWQNCFARKISIIVIGSVHEILQSNATSDRVEMDFSSCVEYN